MNFLGFLASVLVSVTFAPSNYDSSRSYLDEFDVPSAKSLVSYSYGTTYISIDDLPISVPSGDMVVPYYCRFDYSGEYPVLTSLDVYYCHSSYNVINALGVNYAFGYSFNSSSNYAVFKEYNYSALASYGYQDITNGATGMRYVSSSVAHYPSGTTEITTIYSVTNSYPSASLTSFDVCEALSSWYWNICTLLSDSATAAAHQQGWDQGYDVGYDAGYDNGLIDGNHTTPGNIFTHLVESIVGVPMSVLAGLSVFSIFQTPIVGILVTFLLVAVALLIVKRFV